MAVNIGWHGHTMNRQMLNDFEHGQELLIQYIKQASMYIIDNSSKDDMPLDLFNLLTSLQPLKQTNMTRQNIKQLSREIALVVESTTNHYDATEAIEEILTREIKDEK